MKQRFDTQWRVFLAVALGMSPAAPATAQPVAECTPKSTTICEIRFHEDVSGVPGFLRAANNLSLSDEPVSMPRTALVVPATAGPGPHPVVLYNGGHGSTAFGNATFMDFDARWPEAVVVYPEAGRLLGHGGAWKLPSDALTDTDWSPRFPSRETTADHSDLPYLDEVLTRVEALFDVDPERMYVAGHSSGGFFTLSLMHFMPERFRAFAALGAFASFAGADNGPTSSQGVVDAGQIDLPRPLLYMMADAEDKFPWRPATPGARDRVHRTIREVTARNGGSVPDAGDRGYLSEMLTTLSGTADPADRFVTRRFAPVSDSGTEVVFGLYDGDHSWPPKDAADPALVATQWVVDFFKRFDALEADKLQPPWEFPPGWFVPVMRLPTLN